MRRQKGISFMPVWSISHRSILSLLCTFPSLSCSFYALANNFVEKSPPMYSFCVVYWAHSLQTPSTMPHPSWLSCVSSEWEGKRYCQSWDSFLAYKCGAFALFYLYPLLLFHFHLTACVLVSSRHGVSGPGDCCVHSGQRGCSADARQIDHEDYVDGTDSSYLPLSYTLSTCSYRYTISLSYSYPLPLHIYVCILVDCPLEVVETGLALLLDACGAPAFSIHPIQVR